MNKHLNILTKLLIWKWNCEQRYDDWDNINESRKQRIIDNLIYDYLKYNFIWINT